MIVEQIAESEVTNKTLVKLAPKAFPFSPTDGRSGGTFPEFLFLANSFDLLELLV